MSNSKVTILSNPAFSKYNIATFIALLFHVSGCIGMFTSSKGWFIANTPLNLIIVFVLVIWTQKQRKLAFYLFIAIAFITGMVTEMIGVNTGLLFGNYEYGSVLGPKINKVPWLIGINWFIVVYCSGVVMEYSRVWIQKKFYSEGETLSKGIVFLSLVMDAAFLTTFFDWVMEPVAVQLGFWSWLGDGTIPFKNYFCWFIISALLLVVFKLLRFHKHNQFAVHLLIIQLLFFGVLRTFL